MQVTAWLDDEVHMNGTMLIRARGFQAEEYDYTTSDGYILKLVRIPCSRSHRCGGPPVVVMHALLCSSDEFLLDSAEASLGYVLADAGFDVWLLNKRGNTYSKRHTSLSPDSREFWEYTWDEVGLIDIPEQIDFVLRHTPGYSTVGYVGHSEGTTAGFVAASQPRVARRINAMGMLAPIARMVDLGSLEVLRWLMRHSELEVLVAFGHKDFLSSSEFLRTGGAAFCRLCPDCCSNILFFVCGFPGNSNNFNRSRFEVYYSHAPCGTSVHNMVHWMQSVDTNQFQRYDWHLMSKNIAKYGSATPIPYDLSSVPMPIALYAGSRDVLATPKNVEALTRMLPRDKYTLWVDPDYEHMDFVWGMDAHVKVYPQLVEHLRRGASGVTP
eukprot:m51a1_g5925 putative lysosomal acid lipase cholesteryl ester hydrolase-like (383) ;mRNA; f:68861-70297